MTKLNREADPEKYQKYLARKRASYHANRDKILADRKKRMEDPEYRKLRREISVKNNKNVWQRTREDPEKYAKEKARLRELYRANREEILAKRRERLKQPDIAEKRLLKGRERYLKNKDAINKNYARRRRTDPEYKKRINENQRRHYKNHSKEIAEFRKSHDFKVKKRINYASNYKNNHAFRLVQNLRNRLRHAIVLYGKGKKLQSTTKLIGCEVESLIHHLEAQFQNDMSWHERNFHIDHIIPCSAFDLSDPEEQKICFNFRNLRPLPPYDNLSKHAKIDMPLAMQVINQIEEAKIVDPSALKKLCDRSLNIS